MNSVITNENILIKVLKNPELMLTLSIPQWNTCLEEAKSSGLAGRLARDAKDLNFVQELPLKVQNLFKSFNYQSHSSTRKILWEANRVARALKDEDEKVVLLKGATYLMKELRCSQGRISVDLDLLVAKNRIDYLEEKFLAAGWQHQVINDYDQKFYREYSHELPPLVHPDRHISIDVHHSILPVTGKVYPDSKKLLENAVKISDDFYVFSDVDIVLHSIVHLFQDGEIRGGLRNLLEQHDLFSEFGEKPEFWQALVPRAIELGVTRALYYSLKFSGLIFETKIPDDIIKQIKPYGPNFIIDGLMTYMVPGVISPNLGLTGLSSWICKNSLYIRSHWLRMPPWLLAKHLTRKFIMSFQKESVSF